MKQCKTWGDGEGDGGRRWSGEGRSEYGEGMREANKQTGRQAYRYVDKHEYMWTAEPMYRQAVIHIARKAAKQAGKHTVRQIYRQTVIQPREQQKAIKQAVMDASTQASRQAGRQFYRQAVIQATRQ